MNQFVDKLTYFIEYYKLFIKILFGIYILKFLMLIKYIFRFPISARRF